MKQTMQKMMSVLLSLLLLCIPIVYVNADPIIETDEDDIIICEYNNVIYAYAQAAVNNTGLLTINFGYDGYSTTTHAKITTYIEKKVLGLFWTRVNISQPNNEWVDIIYNSSYVGFHTFQLSSSGQYRTTVIFEISGTAGPTDTVKYVRNLTY